MQERDQMIAFLLQSCDLKNKFIMELQAKVKELEERKEEKS